MSERKHTPDVLADLLSSEAPGDAAAADILVPAPKPQRRVRKQTDSPEPRPVRLPRLKPVASQQCWEHRVASFQQHKGWRLRYVDGVLVKDWASGPRVHEYIAALAAEGWQVAGVCSGEALFGLLDKYQVYFKRPAA